MPYIEIQRKQSIVKKKENAAKPEKTKRTASQKLGVFYYVWAIVQFLLYIAIDAIKIGSQGWTVPNIIVTVTLGLQIALFILLHIAGSSRKQSKRAYKTSKKWVKFCKKVVTKCITLVTTIVLLVAAKGQPDWKNVFVVIVTILSLLMLALQLMQTLIWMLIKRKIRNKFSRKKAAATPETAALPDAQTDAPSDPRPARFGRLGMRRNTHASDRAATEIAADEQTKGRD